MFYQTSDVVLPSASDASKDPSPVDADPVEEYHNQLQGSIQSPSTHNDTASGAIRE